MGRRWELGLAVASLVMGLGFNLYSLSGRRRLVYLTDEQLAALNAAVPAGDPPVLSAPPARAQFERFAFRGPSPMPASRAKRGSVCLTGWDDDE